MGGVEKMIDFSDIKLPFNVTDLLISSTGLLKIVGGFLLLGLSFMLIRGLFFVIRASILYSHEDHRGNIYDKNGRLLMHYSAVERRRTKMKEKEYGKYM
ncbi:hypothetical protein KDN24_05425 [Bacillus sp. Bva_UNVM-123]|uniref:hypothetical protein n=1 Tax=Bacillus sp. Bva_UNVM-123 TaxID=2829798 RepID=UPI00391F49A5